MLAWHVRLGKSRDESRQRVPSSYQRPFTRPSDWILLYVMQRSPSSTEHRFVTTGHVPQRLKPETGYGCVPDISSCHAAVKWTRHLAILPSSLLNKASAPEWLLYNRQQCCAPLLRVPALRYAMIVVCAGGTALYPVIRRWS